MVQLRVVVAGHWSPESPEQYLPPTDPPQPQPGESHLAFAIRYVEWMRPDQLNPEWLRWQGRKAWIGQTAEDLRALIEADASIDNECFLVNPQPPR